MLRGSRIIPSGDIGTMSNINLHEKKAPAFFHRSFRILDEAKDCG